MDENRSLLPHTLVIENRNKLTVTGATDIGSFSDESVIIFTDYGEITIQGNSLQVTKLSVDSGEFCAQGNIISVGYTEKMQKNSSIFSKVSKLLDFFVFNKCFIREKPIYILLPNSLLVISFLFLFES